MSRILFTASPSVGHLVPLLTLARAAIEAGHDVALSSAASMAQIVGSVPLLPVGPSWQELNQENARRHPGKVGSVPPPLDPSPADVADFFSRTRLDMVADDVLRIARDFDPEVVVAEAADSVGPFVAAALAVPWAAHGFGIPVPAVFADALRDAAANAYAYAGHTISATSRIAFLDPWPDVLQGEGYRPPADRITVTLEPYTPTAPPGGRRPRRDTAASWSRSAPRSTIPASCRGPCARLWSTPTSTSSSRGARWPRPASPIPVSPRSASSPSPTCSPPLTSPWSPAAPAPFSALWLRPNL